MLRTNNKIFWTNNKIKIFKNFTKFYNGMVLNNQAHNQAKIGLKTIQKFFW